MRLHLWFLNMFQLTQAPHILYPISLQSAPPKKNGCLAPDVAPRLSQNEAGELLCVVFRVCLGAERCNSLAAMVITW